jgi:hypothetical protein
MQEGDEVLKQDILKHYGITALQVTPGGFVSPSTTLQIQFTDKAAMEKCLKNERGDEAVINTILPRLESFFVEREKSASAVR